jgi:hypothetical protein
MGIENYKQFGGILHRTNKGAVIFSNVQFNLVNMFCQHVGQLGYC